MTGERVVLAGPPDRALRSPPAYEGRRGGMLLIVSAKDGKVLKSYRLDFLPVFDGMASAYGRLYISTTDGKVLCLGPEGRPLAPSRPEGRVKGRPWSPGWSDSGGSTKGRAISQRTSREGPTTPKFTATGRRGEGGLRPHRRHSRSDYHP